MPNYTDQNGKKVVLGKELGKGGEGAVYLLSGDPNSVVKIYFPPKRAYYEPRLGVMIANPPEDQTRKLSPPHISISWPERCVYESGKFVGYTMPLIQKAPDIYKIYAPSMRRQEFPNFDWGHLHHVALNLAIAVNAYHAKGYIIGDLNSKNVKVHKNAMVTMIDTDSVQVKTPTGQVLRCPVGTPDFTAPELQGLKLDQYDRDEYHDAFALGVMIFMLLMEGYHPYTGAPVNPSISVPAPAYQYCIKKGIFPYKKNSQFKPPLNAPDFSSLHPEIQTLFIRCFDQSTGKNRTNRPLPIEWYRVLHKVESELVSCSKGHKYFSAYGRCPWCARANALSAISVSVPRPVVTPVSPKPVTPVQTPLRPARTSLTTPRMPAQPIKRKLSGTVKAIIVAGSVTGLGVLSVLTINSINGKTGGNSINIPFVNSLATQTAGNNQQITDPAVMVNSSSCPGAANLIMGIGDHVLVNTSKSLRGHSAPDLENGSVSIRFQYGDSLTIIDGPVCATSSTGQAYWLWQVQDQSGNQAWVAEGDSGLYYLRK